MVSTVTRCSLPVYFACACVVKYSMLLILKCSLYSVAYRGREFRIDFSRIAEMCSLIPRK